MLEREIQFQRKLTKMLEPSFRLQAQLAEAMRPTLDMTGRIVDAMRPIQATADLTRDTLGGLFRANADPVMRLARWAEESRVRWAPPVLKLMAALEQVAAAAQRLHFRMPSDLEFCEEAYSSAQHAGRPQDKQVLLDFTCEVLGLPRADWQRVGAALFLSNWRQAKDPVMYLRRVLQREEKGHVSVSRQQARVIYIAPDELRTPPSNPWEEMESTLALQQTWERSVCDPEVRELVAARMLTDSFEEARVQLGWDRVKLQRIHQRLQRARPELRRLFLNS